jgi:potassium-dependent mechanosensitive channel
LLVEQPIRLGDRTEFGDKTGEVVRVGTRSSWIRKYDNAILIVPSSQFVAKEILNWTASDPKTRVSVSVSVAYRSNADAVMRILVALAEEHEDAMKEPAPVVLLSELAPSGMRFTLRCGR